MIIIIIIIIIIRAAAKKERKFIYKGTTIKLAAVFSSAMMKTKSQWSNIFKARSVEGGGSTRIVYPECLFLKKD